MTITTDTWAQMFAELAKLQAENRLKGAKLTKNSQGWIAQVILGE